jgi:hypothetical protein
MKILPRILVFIHILIGFSCKGTRIVEEKVDDFQGACYTFIEGIKATKPDDFEIDDFDDDLQDIFSERALVVANALNLKDPLREIVKLDREEDQLVYFMHYQEILNKINLAELEVSSLNAAIRCEEDKTEQLAWYLNRKESNISNQRTVGGIVTDASANILSGVVVIWIADANTFRQLMGVGASLATIVLNVLNKVKTYTVEVDHEVNLLRDVYAEDLDWSEYIPPSVWYYINEKKVEIHGETIRENMMQSWDTFNIRENLDLYLSDGGQYSVDQLQNRASMLDLFAAYIELMKQDLLVFRREVVELR